MNSEEKRDIESMALESKLITSVQHLKLTLPRMRNLNIPITPENYAVWYEYSSGRTLELNKSIDDLLNSGATFTEEINRNLHDAYIKEPLPSNLLSSIQSDTEHLLIRLLRELDSMRVGTEHFSNVLAEGARNLESDTNVQVLAALVSRLATELEEVKNSNSSLESILKSMTEEVIGLRTEMKKLHGAAMLDALTGISNRRAFDEALQDLLTKPPNGKNIFSLLMVDIDHFKNFNDTHGHIAGDKVLVFVASLLKNGVKGTDIVARFGGEEFSILLPNTNYKGAMVVANDLCEKIGSKTLVAGSADKKCLGNITVSVGVAQSSPKDIPGTLIERADRALYAAKKGGRNRVTGVQDL
jgi:diguanylate cyclase